MKVKVNKVDCIGCGMCIQILPEIFKMDIDGKSEIINSDITENKASKIDECCDICPTQAISIEV
ncbi:MAG: ferredoxin [Oscillospiraceae bacterium]|jgi:ferredoxin|nr:ferredoxin [Oscillospiraceae bacterium]